MASARKPSSGLVLSAAIAVILVIIALLIVLTSDRDVDVGDPEQAITTSEDDVGTRDVDQPDEVPMADDSTTGETTTDEQAAADGTDDQASTGMADEEDKPADEPMTDAADDSTTSEDTDGQELAPAQEGEPESTTGETTTDEKAPADGTDDQASTGMADEEDKPANEPMTDAADDSTTSEDTDGQELAPAQEGEPASETSETTTDEQTVSDETMPDAADDSTTGEDVAGQEMAPAQEDEPESTTGETTTDEQAAADGTGDQSSVDTDETDTGIQTDEHSSSTRTTAVEMDDTQPEASGPRIDLVRVDEQGLTVLAGQAEPGSSVKAILNDQELVDTRVGSDGTFASIFQISEMQFPAELHLLETDTEGIERISSQSLIILQPPALDTVMAETRHDLSTINESTSNLETTSRPEKVETVALLSSSTGVQLVSPDTSGRNKLLNIISYNIDGEVVMSGSGNPGYLVRIYIDDEYRMQARIDDSGTWSATIIGIDDGLHMVRIDQVEEDGTVVGRIELPFQREPQDRVRQHLTDTDFVDERFTPRIDYGAIELITVQPGYTLWGISRSRYGLGRLYVRIYEANSNQIQDPDLIYPGQVFHIPK